MDYSERLRIIVIKLGNSNSASCDKAFDLRQSAALNLGLPLSRFGIAQHLFFQFGSSVLDRNPYFSSNPVFYDFRRQESGSKRTLERVTRRHCISLRSIKLCPNRHKSSRAQQHELNIHLGGGMHYIA